MTVNCGPSGIGLAVFLLVLVPFLYFSGLLNRGYESRHISFAGFASSNSGMSLGMKTMNLNAGQELVVSYDVNVVRGGLLLWVKPTYAGIAADPIDTLRITSSGQGEFVVRAEDDGYHTLRITGSPGGDECPSGRAAKTFVARGRGA